MQLHSVNIIQIVFAFQCCFGALLLAGQPRFRALVWLLLGNAVLMAFNLVEETGVTRNVHLITPAFSLLWGPLFLLFVASVLDEARSFPFGLHFVPPLAAVAFTDAAQVVLLIGAASQMLYAGWIVRLLVRYGIATQDMRSYAVDMSLTWLVYVLGLFAPLAMIDSARHALQPYLPLAVLHGNVRGVSSALLISGAQGG